MSARSQRVQDKMENKEAMMEGKDKDEEQEQIIAIIRENKDITEHLRQEDP